MIDLSSQRFSELEKEILFLQNIIHEKNSALFYANQRLETIEIFSKIAKEPAVWESGVTRKRIEQALKLGK